MDEYLSTKTTRKLLGVTTETLRAWDKSGKIHTIRSPSGARLYSSTDIYNLMGVTPPSQTKEKIAYARVSFKKQMDDLKRQGDFLQSSFPDHQLVTDVGSGINWKRKGLQTILEKAISGRLSELVVAHPDRLCRFAFELVKSILSTCQVKLVVLDSEEHKSPEQELAEDLLSIVHIYSCRNMGRRRYSHSQSKNSPPSQ